MKDMVDTIVRCFATLFIFFLLLAFIGSFTGCATVQHRAAPAPVAVAKSQAPLAALVVTSCGKSVALYVVTDPSHMILFAGSETVLFEAVAPGMPPNATHADSVPFDTAFALAQRAPLTSHVALPCRDDTV